MSFNYRMVTISIVGIIEMMVLLISFTLVRNGLPVPDFIGEIGMTLAIALAILLSEEYRRHYPGIYRER